MYIWDDVGAVSLIDIAQENNVKNDLIKCGEAHNNLTQIIFIFIRMNKIIHIK